MALLDYCLTSNHVHLLIQVGDQPLGKIMRHIASEYARRMQARLDTTGHFFERRYHATLVDADSYLLELLRYTHCNPVKAGLVSDANLWQFGSAKHRQALGLAFGTPLPRYDVG